MYLVSLKQKASSLHFYGWDYQRNFISSYRYEHCAVNTREQVDMQTHWLEKKSLFYKTARIKFRIAVAHFVIGK